MSEDEAYDDGYDGYFDGMDRDENPHDDIGDWDLFEAWNAGWCDARDEDDAE